MRVAVLTHYFPPEVGAPQARLAALAEGLAARGASVTVHTGFPHYPDGVVLAPYRNRPWRSERIGSVRVVRSLVLPAPNRGFARRLLDHAGFSASALATAPVAGGADVVLVESPPLFLGAAAVPYAWAKRAALVVNIADLWPDSAVQLGALSHPRAISLARRLETFVYRGATRITAPTEGITRILEGRPECEGKVRHTPPFARRELLDTPAVRRSGGPLRVLYAGTVGMAQGICTLLAAAKLVGPEVVEVTVAGSGAEAELARRQVEADGISNVRLLGTVPFEEIPRLYGETDAAVILLRDRKILEGALPTKLLEALAAGRPVIFSGAGEAARMVRRAGCGRVVPPEDAEALAAAFRALAGEDLEALGEAGRRAASSFEQSRGIERWLGVLEEAAGEL